MRASRLLLGAAVVALAAYVLALLLPVPDHVAWLRDGVLGNLVFVLAGLPLALRTTDRPDHRGWTTPVTIGIGLYLAGNLYYFVAQPHTVPSPADIGYLGAYPFLLTGLLLSLREQMRGIRLIVVLDGLCGALAGAAVATWAIGPLIEQVWDGSLSAATTLAYPVCGGVVLAAALGMLGILGVDSGWRLVLWAAGAGVFGAGDIGYGYLLAHGTYQPGGPLDGAWAIGLTLVAAGALHGHRTLRRSVPAARSLLVVAVAAVAAVVVLAGAPTWSHDPTPSVLALMTLVGCAVRLVRAFLQLRELAAIRQQALTDELTGAANRRALYAELDRLFHPRDDEQQGEQRGFGLALIDLDHFKEVNDSYGHAAGDELLRAVVTRFAAALDQLETPHLLARLGGDEFAVILRDVDDQEAAMVCGAALQESLLEPVTLDEVVLHAQASIGVAVAPEHATNRGDMLFAADAAMYASKTSGEPVAFYSPTTVGDRRKRLEVAEDLYSALERGELTVEYQPIMTPDGDLVGAEALVRWDHPSRGRLSPAEFLAVAERYRLTPSIAVRVLEVALDDLARWRAAGADLRMSVNVSASDLRDEGLVTIVAQALLEHDIPPSALLIEVTETAMMRDPETAHDVMQALADLGVQLAVDDYGTGYSSLEYLLRLPIHEIKLDRAFSINIVDELRSVAIVRSTVDLTHALGLRMVAEGVEQGQTLDILRDLGCDLVQGWHLGRPMPPAAFEAFIGVQAPESPEARELRRLRSSQLPA